jgi:hypothetical protein
MDAPLTWRQCAAAPVPQDPGTETSLPPAAAAWRRWAFLAAAYLCGCTTLAGSAVGGPTGLVIAGTALAVLGLVLGLGAFVGRAPARQAAPLPALGPARPPADTFPVGPRDKPLPR